MSTGSIVLLVVLVLVLAFAGWFVATFNRLVRQRTQVRAAGAQVDVQLTRRHDLIPNLVESVKGYAAHERGTLEAVTAARQTAMSALGGPRADQAAAENALTQALGRLFAVAEAYPDLKASQNFLALQQELAGTEDKIAYARQFLNSAVQTLNASVQSFPTLLVAAVGGFHQADFFQSDGDERGPVTVRF
jgi:LemA protein